MSQIREQRDDFNCWRCKNHISKHYINSEVIAGFHANLCLDCRNDWQVYIRNNNILKERSKVGLELNHLSDQTKNSGHECLEQIQGLFDRYNELDKLLFSIAEEWTDGFIIRPHPPEPQRQELTPEQMEAQKELQIARLEKRLEILKREKV